MKYMNMKKRYWTMDLQIFAGDGGDGAEANEELDNPEDEPEDDSEDDPEERKFTQHDVDEATK